MSLATDLTSNHLRLKESGRLASELLRSVRRIMPPEIYNELQLQLINIASETTKLGMNLGALRMIGELEQRPPEVTAARLELASCVPVVSAFPDHEIVDESAAFALELQQIADDTLSEEVGP